MPRCSCGNETANKDGVCAVCKLGVNDIAEELGIGKNKMSIPEKRKCKKEGCEKYAVKEGFCTRCFNEAHGIVKKYGRKKKKESVIIDKHRHRKCSVDACTKQAVKDGLCNIHFQEEHGYSPKKNSSGVNEIIQKLIEKRNAIDEAIKLIKEINGDT